MGKVFHCCAVLLLGLPFLPVHAEDYGEPLQASLTVLPVTANIGQEVELRLTLKVNDPWHVFADTPGSSGQRQMKLSTALPAGIETLGEWQWPKYESVFEGYEMHVYNAGEHVFKRKLKVIAPTGPVTLSAEVTYQACNPEFCGPVEVQHFSVEFQAGSVKPSGSGSGATVTTDGMPPNGSSIAGTPLDMKFTALDGRAVDVAKMRGKVILIDLWATWCVPCVAELPNVKAVYDKYRAQGFEVIGVTFDEADALVKLQTLIREKDLSWPQRFDGKMFDKQAAQLYGIRGIPATFLIDKTGRLVESNVKGSTLEAAVRKYLEL